MLNLLLTRHGNAAAPDVMLGGQLDVPLTEAGRQEAEALARRLDGVRVDRIISSPMARALETAEVIARGRPIEIDERLREQHYGSWEGLTHKGIADRDPGLRARWEEDPAATHAPGGECGNDVAARARSFLVDLLAAELGAEPGAEPRAEPGAEPRAEPRAEPGAEPRAEGATERPTHGAAGAGGPAESRAIGAPATEEAEHHRPTDPGGSRGPVSEQLAEAEGERRVLVVAHGTLDRILISVALGSPIRDYRRRFMADRAALTVLRYERGDGPDGAQLVLANDVAHLRSPGQAPWG